MPPVIVIRLKAADFVALTFPVSLITGQARNKNPIELYE
jgi:hypothetical protein